MSSERFSELLVHSELISGIYALCINRQYSQRSGTDRQLPKSFL